MKLVARCEALSVESCGLNLQGFHKDTVEFYFESRDMCKNFWKVCLEHHAFFRCQSVKRLPRRNGALVSRGSSFRQERNCSFVTVLVSVLFNLTLCLILDLMRPLVAWVNTTSALSASYQKKLPASLVG